MARTQEFETENAIALVMREFWQHGYENVRYEDLVAATGVSRRGLYSVFGDKSALFLVALRRYRSTFVQELFCLLLKPDIRRSDLAVLVEHVAQMVSEEEPRRGCMIANASIDAATHPPAVREQICEHLAWLTALFESALRRLQLSAEQSADLAHYFVGVLQGLFLMGRANASPQSILTFAKLAIGEHSPMSRIPLSAEVSSVSTND